MEIFGYMLDIESIELSYVEDGEINAYGIGVLSNHEKAVYNPDTQTLSFTLQFYENDTPFYYEYKIEREGGKFIYLELESQREGRKGSWGDLELIDEEDQIVLHDEGNGSYSNTFYIPKLDG